MWHVYNVTCLFQLRYVGRDVSGTPATGIGEIHQKETKQIIEAVFAK